MKLNLYRTATLITVLSILERMLGFLYRIVLSRLLGAEGLGIYQIALSVFAVFLTFGTGGIPTTLTRLIAQNNAENGKNADKITSAGFVVSILFSLPFLLLFLLFPKGFSFLFSDKRCLPVFGVLIWGILLSSLYSVVRGRFWGEKKLFLPAILDILEESIMVIAGVLLLQNIHSPLDGAKKAAFAVVLSYFASFFCIYLVYFLRKNKISKPNGKLKPLLSSALPITAVRTSSSLLASAVAVLFPAALIKIGMSSQEAMANFGVVSGMVMPVLSTPATIIGSISLVLIPELSESFYQKNDERLSKNIERGLYSAVVISCFLIPFFFVLGEDLGNFLFSNLLSGKMIRICSFTLLPFSVMMISTGILNAIGKQKSTLLYFFIGSAGMLFTVLFLPSVLGIYAYPFGLFVSHTITSICNIIALIKTVKLPSSLLKKSALLVAFILPVSLVGELIQNGMSLLFGGFLSFLCSCILLALFTLLLFVFSKVLPIGKWKTIFFIKIQKKSTKLYSKD